MCNNHYPSSFNKDPEFGITLFAMGILAGGFFGALAYSATMMDPLVRFVCISAIAGGILFSASPVIIPVWRKFIASDWKVSEIEVQGVKFINDASQRRAAWKIFFNMTTRVTLRAMKDDEGDDGVALKSFYDFFQETRTIIMELDSAIVVGTDSVETYALSTLNDVIAPFLAKWHPVWDKWNRGLDKSSPSADVVEWDQHHNFRDDMRQVQDALRVRALALALIAGVHQPESYLAGAKTNLSKA